MKTYIKPIVKARILECQGIIAQSDPTRYEAGIPDNTVGGEDVLSNGHRGFWDGVWGNGDE